ncbi:MAG: S-layer homology domain-containing protein [Clostridia bacterium]|nr:S-layer homology domain-containing protein [Clostridia bacterium]
MKKVLSIILCITLVLSCVSSFAASTDDEIIEKTEPIAHGDLAAPSEWAREYVSKADRIGMTDYFKVPWTQIITRTQFCHLAYNMLDRATDIEWKHTSEEIFDDTDNAMVISLYLEGIIEGKGDKIFAPHDEITREEAATILKRIAEYTKLGYTEMYFEFDDGNQISEWASDSVQRVCNLGVMQGVGNNKFDPKGGYTVEQAITTLVRMFDVISDDKFAYMSFADKMYVNMPVDKNYMFSPLSIKMALMMAANGASGKTKTEILDTINVADIDHYNECIRLMIEEYSQSELLKMNISNSIWINSDNTSQRFGEEYNKKLAEVFNAESGVVNNKTAEKEINGWVNEKTQGKIPSIITRDNANFWAMLVNAVYFKGRWQNEFNKSATKKDDFYSRDGKTTSIDFMNKTSWMNYSKKDGITIVELPYLTREEIFDENGEYVETKKLQGVNISMYLMMSDRNFSPEEALYEPELKSKYIALSVPKFDIEYSVELNDILKTVGIKKAFETDAEFRGMFDGGNMWLDSTIHKTYIKVDEEGTEAAAVTGAGMGATSLPPEPLEIKYNKPFTFVIKDNINGEILFMGEYAFAN